MTDRIRHRGPDDSGQWIDQRAGIHMGFRRLSILDLSQAGHQPMLSHSGRYVCTFNGEIYNFSQLKSACENTHWRGHSDTEVLLEHIERYGLERTLKIASGMFAIALWDKEAQTLSLARDRLGEKPLYYGWLGSNFVFASELKALAPFHPKIDLAVLPAYLSSGYIAAPFTIYQGIHKLPAGTVAVFRPGTSIVETRPYWSILNVSHQDKFAGSDQEAVDQLDHILRSVVKDQMVADVPLGAFLSGGVDSSLIVALMQASSSRPIKTFTMGFQDEKFNEAPYARAISRHLGTEHHEHIVSPQDALEVLPLLPKIFDEPFADKSQIPTYLVSQIARHNVTVSLSGDGGDEVFGGYSRYLTAQRLWSRLSRVPKPVRAMSAKTIQAVSPRAIQSLAGKRRPLTGDRAHKFSHLLLDAHTQDDLYSQLTDQWPRGYSPLSASQEPLKVTQPDLGHLDFAHRMMARDTLTYLPDDILVKVDRSSMAVSLESRAPFLHPHVVEFAWQLPLNFKMRDGKGKWILRQVLERYVPRELIERPKRGFSVPIDSWLRGPLREWGENLIAAVPKQGILNPQTIQRLWSEHQSGIRNWQHPLWSVLMFQAWLEEYT